MVRVRLRVRRRVLTWPAVLSLHVVCGSLVGTLTDAGRMETAYFFFTSVRVTSRVTCHAR